MHVELDQAAAQRSLNMFRTVGFAHVRQEAEFRYEQHLLENRKFLSFAGSVVAEIGELEFYDDPMPDTPLGDGLILGGARRFNWQHRFLGISPNFPADQEMIRTIANDGFCDGFPLGIVTDDQERIAQILALGEVTMNEFCRSIRLSSGEEVRLYSDCEELPVLDSADLN